MNGPPIMQNNAIWGKVLISWFLFSHVLIALLVSFLGFPLFGLRVSYQTIGTFVLSVLLLEVLNCGALFFFAVFVGQKRPKSRDRK